MRFPCLIFCVILSVLSQTECVLNGDLVQSNSLTDYKYLVAILARQRGSATSQACGGAILNDRLILTAAHCFAKRADRNIPDQTMLRVIAHTRSNREMITEGFLLRHVAKIYVHAGYFTSNVDHDIAIVQLTANINLLLNFHKVKAVKLPPANFATAGKESWLAGYGVHEIRGAQRISDGMLRSMRVTPVADRSLDALLISGRPTDTSGARGFCDGDSGGPLVIRTTSSLGLISDYTVIGLVKSNKPACDDRVSPFGIYTRVSAYLTSFINKIMANPDNVSDRLIKIKDVRNVQSCEN